MVLTWQTEPTADIAAGFVPAGKPKATRFTSSARFRRDGTSREDRIPNFVNETGPQGTELCSAYVPVDTCTHTTYQDRLCAAHAVMAMADQMESMLWTPPSMKSQLQPATNKSLLSNDTRFDVLQDSTSEQLGPGRYWIEGGLPALGPLPPELPSRTTSPARDPGRQSKAFTSPSRGEVFRTSEAPGRVYIQPEYKPAHDGTVAWSSTSAEARAPVQDYRFNGRFHDSARQVPVDAEYPSSVVVSQAGKLLRLADCAKPKPDTATQAFKTKEARLSCLPAHRSNDARLSRPRRDEDPQALGPGSYTPLTSTGAARKKTYRLFVTPHGNNRQQNGRDAHRPSASFVGTYRGHKAGPFAWSMDSSLTRTY